MASTFLPPNPNFLPTLPHTRIHHQFCPNCTSSTSNSTPDPEFPSPGATTRTTVPAESFPIEKRRKSEILRERRGASISKKEPPNFEIGWKRTKETQKERPVGYMVVDFLAKLEELMGRGEFGSVALLAKAGEIVAERAREEAEVLAEEGKVEERMVTELVRVLKLMEMDLAMVRAAVKEETLRDRVEAARARCRQAILVASSF